MRMILFGIYGAGVLLSLLCFQFLEWWLALALLAFLPLAALHMAEAKGIVQFAEYRPEEPTRAIDKAMVADMTDEQAAAKFGWQIVTEMDDKIKQAEGFLQEAKQRREAFAALVKGDKQ